MNAKVKSPKLDPLTAALQAYAQAASGVQNAKGAEGDAAVKAMLASAQYAREAITQATLVAAGFPDSPRLKVTASEVDRGRVLAELVGHDKAAAIIADARDNGEGAARDRVLRMIRAAIKAAKDAPDGQAVSVAETAADEARAPAPKAARAPHHNEARTIASFGDVADALAMLTSYAKGAKVAAKFTAARAALCAGLEAIELQARALDVTAAK